MIIILSCTGLGKKKKLMHWKQQITIIVKQFFLPQLYGRKDSETSLIFLFLALYFLMVQKSFPGISQIIFGVKVESDKLIGGRCTWKMDLGSHEEFL